MSPFLILLLAIPAVSAAPTEEQLLVAGLKQPAEILVDKWGVPHIYAKSVDDAWFVQGFNAARDRLFQIDLWRRRGLGQLAAVLGPGHVERDRAARLFLYRGDMNKEWAAYGPAAKAMAAGFAAGVNAYVEWLATHKERMPVEFQVLGYSPAKWDASDVVRIRTHGLTGNLTYEVTRANTICKTDPVNGPRYDQIRTRLQPKWDTKVPDGLDPCLPSDVLRVFTLATSSVRFSKENGGAVAMLDSPPELNGSNNWTIGPSRTATGRPILANDPHRAYSTPSLRYLAHLNAPGLDVIGGGEPSLPGISIGHNGTIAFGLTRFYIDQEDLYVYELNPSNPRQYRYRQGWESMRVLRETIQVKGSAMVEAELLFTRHGPVINADARRAYAVRSGWLEPGMSAYFGSAAYMAAKNFQEFHKSLASAGAPGLNYVYADVKGNIGWIPAGLSPIRPNWDGLLPVPGDGRYEWAGFRSTGELPSIYNPPQGHFSTSNELNLPADYPYQERKLGFEWVNPSRHNRIEEVLQSRSKLTVEDSMRLQTDNTSIPARRLVALLAPLRSSDRKTQAALDLMRGWDGVESAESPQAALLEVWISHHLNRAFLNAVLPRKAADAIASPDMSVMLETLEKPAHRLVPERLLLPTLTAAYTELEKLEGSASKAWQWGKLHHSFPAHPLAGAVDATLRAKLQIGPFPKSGGPFSPNQSAYRGSDFQQTSGPSLRVVIDVGNWDNSRAVNYPGQSGDPDNPHYRDLTGMWSKGEYFHLLYTRAAVEAATEKRIVLRPGAR